MARQFNGRSSINSRITGPSHRPSLWAGFVSIFLLISIGLLRLMGDELYHYPLNPDTSALDKDVLIICLAGGKFRVEAALDLYSKGIGKKLLVVGAGKKSSALGLVKALAPDTLEKISSERFAHIHVETESKNTIENAFAVSRFLQQNPEQRKILLITSGYHMRRAQVMIQNQMDDSFSIIPFTPPSEAISKENWWHTWLGIEVTIYEYIKFLLASLLAPHLKSF